MFISIKKNIYCITRNTVEIQSRNLLGLIDCMCRGVWTYAAEPYPILVCDSSGNEMMGRLVGADPRSVTMMNGLSVNLHLLFISFYQPTPQRYKILTEAGAFCSDMVITSDALFHIHMACFMAGKRGKI